ncbi:hypothetical protein Q8F55_004608 [Vanrija albida]|uniref:2-dehydropantoate 2-reductase n=1 Tax=Vanrija albida TaxID=181172 RepID=A0ABR3Q775_9TREE
MEVSKPPPATPQRYQPKYADDAVDVLLIGLGSIGTVYAYLLERSGKVRVTAVARSNYPLYAGDGVTIDSQRFGTITNFKPYRVFKSQAEALADGTRYALCVVATKCLPDITPNAKLLEDSIKSGQVGAFVLIQNGLRVEEDLYAAASSTPIVSCIGWIAINTNPSGDVVTWKGVEKTGTGLFPVATADKPHSAQQQAAIDLWVNLLQAGEGNVVLTDNIDSMRYGKNVWTATWAGMQGLIRTPAACFEPLGEAHHAQIKKYMREIQTLGWKTGLLHEGMVLQPMGLKVESIDQLIDFDFSRFVTEAGRTTAVAHKWSLLLDVENNRPFEVEVIFGSMVRLAREHGIETPLIDFVYTLLSGLQASIVKSRTAAASDAPAVDSKPVKDFP